MQTRKGLLVQMEREEEIASGCSRSLTRVSIRDQISLNGAFGFERSGDRYVVFAIDHSRNLYGTRFKAC